MFYMSLLFFFKQKTAYEMRISDWSSDVCSSDLWAEQAVREGASLPAAEAVKQHVVDLLAGSLDDLFTQIDGRVVKLRDTEAAIESRGLTEVPLDPDWRSELLAVVTNTKVALKIGRAHV